MRINSDHHAPAPQAKRARSEAAEGVRDRSRMVETRHEARGASPRGRRRHASTPESSTRYSGAPIVRLRVQG